MSGSCLFLVLLVCKLRERIFAHRGFHLIVGDMRVDLRCINFLKSQDLFKHPDVNSVLVH